MTQSDKELLLKDLCARFPYGVKCKFFYTENKKSDYGISFLETEVSFKNIEWFLNHKDDFVDIKPYLRPMSNMTGEERAYYSYYQSRIRDGILGAIGEYLNWLNTNHFDYRGLLPMGLALEASEGMYKTE